MMKKGLIFILFVLLLTSQISALSLNVEKVEKAPVIISELKNPAVFYFIFDNSGASEDVQIYSLLSVSFEPRETFNLKSGSSTKEIKVYPGESIRKKDGNYAFEYQIKGAGPGIFKDQLVIKIVKLADVLKIEPQGIDYGDREAVIKITNTQNLRLSNATLAMSSVFFDGTKDISLGPFESASLSIPIKAEEVRDLAAGAYVISSNLKTEGVNAKIENTVSYREKQEVGVKSTSDGWLIKTTSIERTNRGNLAVPDRVKVTKNVLTRLFTTFSVEPLSSERKGLFVDFMWEKDIKPAESWKVEIKTNYTLPFILILLIVFISSAVYIYSRTALVVRKRCSFVKTRGGEFALKVFLHLKARKEVDNIELFDRIPMAAKIYEKAGMPHKFDERIGKLSWKVDRLNAGEERIFSYIIYSTVRIVGRLELSPATAHFVHEGKSTYVHSNRTYFVSDVAPRY